MANYMAFNALARVIQPDQFIVGFKFCNRLNNNMLQDHLNINTDDIFVVVLQYGCVRNSAIYTFLSPKCTCKLY